MTKLSLLDLAHVTEGGDVATSLSNAADIARHAESLGFERYWCAEHHGMEGIASAATSVVIGHVAAATSTIRVGAGGIMLPNHSPLVIAEQFGTLEALFPGRIDLGLGRAPGSDQRVAAALRRNLNTDAERAKYRQLHHERMMERARERGVELRNGMGQGSGKGMGKGQGMGQGMGQKNGQGMGQQNGQGAGGGGNGKNQQYKMKGSNSQ